MNEAELIDRSVLVVLESLRLPGQPDPVDEILLVFKDDSAAVLDTLGRAVRGGDADGARRAAHRMKGSASQVGGIALSARLQKIEYAARDGDLVLAARLLEDVPRLRERTLVALYGAHQVP